MVKEDKGHFIIQPDRLEYNIKFYLSDLKHARKESLIGSKVFGQNIFHGNNLYSILAVARSQLWTTLFVMHGLDVLCKSRVTVSKTMTVNSRYLHLF